MQQADLSPSAIYKRLFSYALNYWQVFSIGVVGMVALAGADTTLAWLIKPIMDEGFVNRDPVFIKWLPFVLFAIFLWRGIAHFVTRYSLFWVGRSVVKQLRTEIFEQFLQLPTAYFEASTSGQLMAKLTYHVEQVATGVTRAVISLVKDSLTVIGLIGLMFYLSPKLAIVSIVGGPLIGVVMSYVSKRFRRYSGRIQSSMGDVSHVSEEVIGGHRIIKIFGGHDYERQHFEEVNEKNRVLNNKLNRSREISTPVVQCIAAVAISTVVYLATNAQGEDALSPGTFISFFGALIGIMGPLRRLSEVNADIQKAIAAASNIFDLLGERVEDQGGDYSVDRAEGRLSYANVSFRYPKGDKLVLRDVSLQIEPGKMVAFVGRSGSGKSTLLGLIPRFYDVTGGQILLDGTDVREYRLANLRDQISLVDQSIVLFNDTVARNIAYGGLKDVTEAQVIEAAKSANAWDFIQALPQGLETVVGQHGVLLSGGQRQRLAIARALLKDAPVLILDEATSSLDTESEQKIQEGLEVLMRGRTTLVIAHRLSTVQNADMIVVMDEGHIVETGTHAELLARGGHYAALYRVQLAGAAESSESTA